MRVYPFRALKVRADAAPKVACVPYDVVDTAEARRMAGNNPDSYLHVIRPEIGFPEDWDPYAPEVYTRGAENFARLQADGFLVRAEQPELYVYSQRDGSHVQHGIVACCDTGDYETNLIRKHEKTRVGKENDRLRHIGALHAHTEPVFLSYEDDSLLTRLIAEAQKARPFLQFADAGGIEHSAWTFPDPSKVVEAFKPIPRFYIADGHHRAAAAGRLAGELSEAGPDVRRFLVILYQAGSLQIHSINRCVRDLNGLSEADFLDALRTRFRVTENVDPRPGGAGDVRMCLGGRWYGLSWAPDTAADPVAGLDVSVLQNRLLEPVLEIRDPRTDPRLFFVEGPAGAAGIERRVAAGEAAVGFRMHPITVRQVMGVADAGLIMPPKSTWFAPKPMSGLLVHTF